MTIVVPQTIRPHVLITQHPNLQMRTYHVTRQLSDVHMFGFGVECMHSSFDKKDPGVLAKRLARALARVPGITEGHVDQYTVTVAKGHAFSWADVSPMVLGKIIQHVFAECNGSTIEVSTTTEYMSGNHCHHEDRASHAAIPVKFYAKRRPIVKAEHLFIFEGLRQVSGKAAA